MLHYIVVTTVVCAFLILCLLNALGFTAGGILLNSFGAYLMAWLSPITKGSLVAILQSMGALGLASPLLWIIAVIIAVPCMCICLL